MFPRIKGISILTSILGRVSNSSPKSRKPRRLTGFRSTGTPDSSLHSDLNRGCERPSLELY